MIPQERQDVRRAARYFLLGPCIAQVVGSHIKNMTSTENNPATTDLYGERRTHELPSRYLATLIGVCNTMLSQIRAFCDSSVHNLGNDSCIYAERWATCSISCNIVPRDELKELMPYAKFALRDSPVVQHRDNEL